MIFVADYYINEIRRGAEVANEALLSYLPKDIEKVQSLALQYINPRKFYIITNFCGLSDKVKEDLIKCKNYLIYEHDHKYIITRNPFLLPDGTANPSGKVPDKYKINVDFYKNAKVVLCQTNWHMMQLQANLDCNLDEIGGSFYTNEDLDLLDKIGKYSDTRKDKYAIFNDAEFIHIDEKNYMKQGPNIKNKKGALEYCIQNKLPYAFVPRINDKIKFWQTLAGYQNFVFLPDIPETCSRLLIETKMLNMHVITNNNSGAYYEHWFTLNGYALIDFFREVVVPRAIEKFRSYL